MLLCTFQTSSFDPPAMLSVDRPPVRSHRRRAYRSANRRCERTRRRNRWRCDPPLSPSRRLPLRPRSFVPDLELRFVRDARGTTRRDAIVPGEAWKGNSRTCARWEAKGTRRVGARRLPRGWVRESRERERGRRSSRNASFPRFRTSRTHVPLPPSAVRERRLRRRNRSFRFPFREADA